VVLGEYFATLALVRKTYPTDLSDAEWNYIEPHLPAPKGFGRPRTHSLREIIDAIFYLLKSGCQWRLLPHDFPRRPTVYHYFRKWRRDGTWERVNRAIRERLRGVRLKRDPKPSACVVDSQSVKSTAVGGEERAVTTGARRSRTLKAPHPGGHRGLRALKAKVHSAKVVDHEGIKALLWKADERFPRLSHLWVDALASAQRARARTGSRRPWAGAWTWWSVRKSPPPKRC
jgi:putative transposase